MFIRNTERSDTHFQRSAGRKDDIVVFFNIACVGDLFRYGHEVADTFYHDLAVIVLHVVHVAGFNNFDVSLLPVNHLNDQGKLFQICVFSLHGVQGYVEIGLQADWPIKHATARHQHH